MRTLVFSVLISACFLFSFSFVMPLVTQAAGLVPCDGVVVRCEACKFIELTNRVVIWLITFLTLLCGLMAAVAGLRIVMSGGDSHALSEAKDMMTNVVVGFLILLSAWLVVDTVMKTFVDSSEFGPWNKISCVAPPAGQTGVTPTTIPPVAGECTVPPLEPLTDPASLQMEGGATVIWEGTQPALRACADKFIGKVGGSVTSAYRPGPYQRHLKDIHTLWCSGGLSTNSTAACASLKSTVEGEMSKHALSCSRPVANVSNHTSGRAIDVSSSVAHGSAAVRAAATESCLTWYGAADPVHYTLRSGCTCN